MQLMKMTKNEKVWIGLVPKKAVDQLVLLTNAAELLEKWSILLPLVKRIQNVVVVKIRSLKNEANGIDPVRALAVQTTDGESIGPNIDGSEGHHPQVHRKTRTTGLQKSWNPHLLLQ